MRYLITCLTCCRTVCGFLSNSALGSVDALLKPFHTRLWVAVVAIAAVVLLLNKYFRNAETPGEVAWPDVFISSFGTFTGQGVN